MKKIVKDKISFFVNETSPLWKNDFWHSVEENRWENEAYAILSTFLDKNNSYIDIGAWIGPTVLFGSQVARHCYAIEPDPVAFAALKNNIAINPGIVNKITLFEGCISDKCGKVRLGTKTNFGDSGSSLLFDKDAAIEVESLTLDEFLKKNKIIDCNFIKMDIEGGEAIVLPYIKKYLHSIMPTLFLSLHPFFFKNKETDVASIIDMLRIYPCIFNIDGTRTSLDKLTKRMLEVKWDSFSIIAVRAWPFYKRLYYIFRHKAQKITNKIKRMSIKNSRL
jgi:FkbM family methyltransferase